MRSAGGRSRCRCARGPPPRRRQRREPVPADRHAAHQDEGRHEDDQRRRDEQRAAGDEDGGGEGDPPQRPEPAPTRSDQRPAPIRVPMPSRLTAASTSAADSVATPRWSWRNRTRNPIRHAWGATSSALPIESTHMPRSRNGVARRGRRASGVGSDPSRSTARPTTPPRVTPIASASRTASDRSPPRAAAARARRRRRRSAARSAGCRGRALAGGRRTSASLPGRSQS